MLYDTPYVAGMFDQGGVLRVGSLLHRQNTLERSICDVYVRSHYNIIYDRYLSDAEDIQNFFFTGTPGIGKSCLRTYYVWRMVQQAKEEKQTCVIWLGKSPEGKSTSYVIRIREGNMEAIQMLDSIEASRMSSVIEDEGIPVYGHFDVSEGNTKDVPIFSLGFNCFYTSPNEFAWKELEKFLTQVICIPCWSLDELEDFYVRVGCPQMLFAKLQAAGHDDHEIDGVDTTRVGTVSASVSRTVTCYYQAKSSDSVSTITVDRSLLRSIIEEEAGRFGYVPRNMFLSRMLLTTYKQRILRTLPTTEFSLDARLVSFGSNMHNRLLSINPKQLPDGSFEYGQIAEGTKQWLGSFVGEILVNECLANFKQKMESAAFARLFNCFRSDLKLYEIASLGCLMLQPSFFTVVRCKPKMKQVKPKVDLGVPEVKGKGERAKRFHFFKQSGIDLTSPRLQLVSNQELLKFAGDIHQSGLAAPFNTQCPCIDGIGHFDQGLTAQGRRSIVTALIQVTVSEEKSVLGPEAEELQLLEKVVARCKQGGSSGTADLATVDHKIVFVWFVDPEVGKKGKTLSATYAKKLSSLGVEEYLVFPSVDQKP